MSNFAPVEHLHSGVIGTKAVAFEFTLSSRPDIAAEVREGEQGSRQYLLDHLTDIFQWAQEMGACRDYLQRLRSLLRAREDGDEAALTGFLDVGDWPRGDAPRGPHIRPLRAVPRPCGTRDIQVDGLTLVVPEAPPRFTGAAARVLLDLLSRHQASLSDPANTLAPCLTEG